MKVAVLGDIGQSVYHVGDEAMTHAAVHELNKRGINEITLLTRNVEDTRQRFSLNASLTLQFPWPAADRQRYLGEIKRVLDGDRSALPPHDQIWGIIETIRSSDALLIAGGGNMNSIFGWLLYERAAAVEIARVFGKPVVISGQTFGPVLHGRDREVVANMLSTAGLAGARESTSLALGRDLSDSVVPCLDDASFMNGPTAERTVPFIAATFSNGTGSMDRNRFITRLARTLDHAVQVTGLPIIFLPHMSTGGAGDGDEAMHADIAKAMTSPKVESRIIISAEETAALTARAAMVITSRYHPVVFALDGGVPAVALAVEDYSFTRLRGALDNWGLGGFALTLPSILDGGFQAAIDETWNRRAEMAAHIEAQRPDRLAEFTSWWNAVVRGLAGESPDVPEVVSAETFNPAGAWLPSREGQKLFLAMSTELAELRAANEHIKGEASDAQSELHSWLSSNSFKTARKLATVRAWLRPGKP